MSAIIINEAKIVLDDQSGALSIMIGNVLYPVVQAAYALPVASVDVLGGIKIGEGLINTGDAAQVDVVWLTEFLKDAVLLPYTLHIGEVTNGTVNVTKGTDPLIDEANIMKGDNITIAAIPVEGYQLATLTVNGEDFTSGETYTVVSDATIMATFEVIP